MNYKALLTKSLRKPVKLSPMLRHAITDILACLKRLDTAKTVKAQQSDFRLAYQLSACKSWLSGEIDPKDKVHAFQEDDPTSKKVLGDTLYCILDGLHHELAFKIGAMPSGMMAMCSNGQTSEMKPSGTHPVIQRMIEERKTLYKE